MTAITAQDLRRINEDIWSAMLGLPLVHGDTRPVADGARRVTGLVQITGAWTGAVGLQLSDELARRATAIMFDVDVADASIEDTRDAVGELANVTAGNVKSLVGSPAQLSLPSVTVGVDYEIAIPGAHVREKVGFRCDAGRMIVTVLEQDGRDGRVARSPLSRRSTP